MRQTTPTIAALRFANVLTNIYELASTAAISRDRNVVTLDSMHGRTHEAAITLAADFYARPTTRHDGKFTTFTF